MKMKCCGSKKQKLLLARELRAGFIKEQASQLGLKNM
jgi:hypothetical protein